MPTLMDPPPLSPASRKPVLRSRRAFRVLPNDRRTLLRRTALVLAVAGLVTLGVTQKYRFIAKRFGVVEEGLIYRSGQISKWMFEKTVEKYGIEVVIDLNGIEPNDEHQAAEIASIERLGLQLHRLPLGGNGTGDISRYAEAHEIIAAAASQNRPVLVHCAGGAQRTGGVIATYRVLVQNVPGSRAYAELLEYNWKPGRDQDMLIFVNAQMRELAEILVERGLISKVPDPLPFIAPAGGGPTATPSRHSSLPVTSRDGRIAP